MRDAYLMRGLTTGIMVASLALFYLVWFRDLSAKQILLVDFASLAITGAFSIMLLRIVSRYRKSN